MSTTAAHYLRETELQPVQDALYHEGLGWLDRREFVANIPNLIGSPGEAPRVYAVVQAVLDGAYRGFGVECDRPDCACR